MSAKGLLRRAIRLTGYDVMRNIGHPDYRLVSLLNGRGVDLVLDVGANTGQYGHRLREFGYQGRIVSFEPMRREFAALSATAARDENWDAVQLAMGAAAGTAEINVAGNSFSSSLLPMLDTHQQAAPNSTYTGTEVVKVERLDDVMPDVRGGAVRPFLKIDTQGFEKEVLAGGTDSLADIVGVQIEMSFVPLYEGQMLVSETVAMMEAGGFSWVSVDPGFTAPDGRMLQMDGVFFRLG